VSTVTPSPCRIANHVAQRIAHNPWLPKAAIGFMGGLGAAAAGCRLTSMPDYRRERPQRFVDSIAIRENIQNVRIDDGDIRTPSVSDRRHSTDRL